MAVLERIRQISFKQVVLGGLASAIGAVLWWWRNRKPKLEGIKTVDDALAQLSRAVEDYVGEAGIGPWLSRVLFNKEGNTVEKAKALLARKDMQEIIAKQHAKIYGNAINKLRSLLERALERNADPLCRVFIEAGVDVSAVGQLGENRGRPFIMLFERAKKPDLVDKSLQQILKNHEDSQKVSEEERRNFPDKPKKAIRQIERILKNGAADRNTTALVMKKMTSKVLRVVPCMTLLEWAQAYQLPIFEWYVWSGRRDMSDLTHADDQKAEHEVLTLVMQEIAATEVDAAGGAGAKERQQPLLWAARTGQTGLLGGMLDKRCNIAVQDTFGYTALHHAVANQRKDAVVLLLQDSRSNQIVNIRTKAGQTALDKAERNLSSGDIAQLLRNHVFRI